MYLCKHLLYSVVYTNVPSGNFYNQCFQFVFQLICCYLISYSSILNLCILLYNYIIRGCRRQPLYYFHFDFRYVTLDRYIYIYIYNMCFHASTTTLNLYANLYYAKIKWLLFETKDIFQKCNSTIKTLLGLKTAAKDIWSILGRTKSSF